MMRGWNGVQNCTGYYFLLLLVCLDVVMDLLIEKTMGILSSNSKLQTKKMMDEDTYNAIRALHDLSYYGEGGDDGGDNSSSHEQEQLELLNYEDTFITIRALHDSFESGNDNNEQEDFSQEQQFLKPGELNNYMKNFASFTYQGAEYSIQTPALSLDYESLSSSRTSPLQQSPSSSITTIIIAVALILSMIVYRQSSTFARRTSMMSNNMKILLLLLFQKKTKMMTPKKKKKKTSLGDLMKSSCPEDILERGEGGGRSREK